ncbi:MAG: metal-dependent transcriptional regulator [Spirochaetes bacterium]|nr:metal-dependent transcriptional regulator [Spirochaetota bacterium]
MLKNELTSTVEDYLKVILSLELNQSGDDAGSDVSMKMITDSLGLKPGTVTSMIKKLSEHGLVEYKKQKGCILTNQGRKQALSLLRKHRLIETFLVNSLKMDWADVHVEAEKLEHAFSDKVIDKLDAFLGFPERDPHGSLIPSSIGFIRKDKNLIALPEAEIGKKLLIRTVPDHKSEFLNYLKEKGLKISSTIQIDTIQKEAGLIIVDSSNKKIPFSITAAMEIKVSYLSNL